ncbi:MAG: hypothetical protein F4W93_04685 [Dehalococcoidia bacterium]|nr:hypothetical protein [Dehalococcoidia bacterium]
MARNLTDEDVAAIANMIVGGWWDAIGPVSDRVDDIDDKALDTFQRVIRESGSRLALTITVALLLIELEIDRAKLENIHSTIKQQIESRMSQPDNEGELPKLQALRDGVDGVFAVFFQFRPN